MNECLKWCKQTSHTMACLRNSRLSLRKRLFLRVLLDVVCVILVAAGILAIKYGSKPYHRGFFCDDESIKHPVLSDTISVALCVAVGVLLPAAVIILIELLLRKSHSACFIAPGSYVARNKSWLGVAYNSIAVFIFGMSVTQFLTEVGKYSIGRLRPHFLTLCNPNWASVNCTTGFITADVCTSTDTDMMTEARLSFPSGHSSFSMYCMLYLILYLQARVSFQAISFLKPVLQLVFFSLAFFTCLSRISDYKHHWSDVLSGAILGIAVCILVVLSLTDFGKYLCNSGLVCIPEREELVQSRNQTIEENLDAEAQYRSTNNARPKHTNSSPETSDGSHIVSMQQVDL